MPSKANGEITAPPSKSMAHRALIFGAFSEKSVIKNVAFSKDIEATIGCLKSLGAKIDINGNTVTVGGLVIKNIPENAVLDCFESGSTLRFFLPLCMAAGKSVTLKGAKRLFERPLSIYEEIAKEQCISFVKNEDSVTVCGNLKSGEYFVRGDISSQFITGLLIALPLLNENSSITVTGSLESASYIDLTLKAMRDFGIKISNVSVLGLDKNTLQGDRVYIDIFNGLKNGKKEFDLSDCPDLAPICFSLASVLGGGVFTGTARLKIKESDRALAMQTELKKFGINVLVQENRVIIENGILKTPNEILCGYNDHRIVMALSVLCSLVGGTVSGAQAVSKSYPSFFEDISNLGLDTNEIN